MTEPTVGDLMTRPVLTVAADDPVVEVAGAMREQGVNSVVVIDEACHPTHVLTSTDYVAMTADGVDPHVTTVAAVATEGVVTVGTGESVGTAARAMAEHDISHLPVVDDDGEVVGILTTTDLAAHVGAT
jgi:CBS domain-containing protein